MHPNEEKWRKWVAYIVNIVLANTGWCLNVLGAAAGRKLLGPTVQPFLATLHCIFVCPMYDLQWKRESVLILCVACYGFIVDSILGLIFKFFPWKFCPPFIAALWANFAMTLGVSLESLRGVPSPLINSFVGAVFGPISYLSGVRIGAVKLHPGGLTPFLCIVAIEWGISLPILIHLSKVFSPKTSSPEPVGSHV